MKAKVKEKENGKGTEIDVSQVSKITLGEVYGVSRSIFELSGSVPSMKGKIIYALTKNEAILEKILTKADNDRGQMLKNYVKLNKDGSFKYLKQNEDEIAQGHQPVLDYKNEKGKQEAAIKIQNLMEAEVNVDFHKIDMSVFDNLDIAPSRNTNIGLFIKYLVSETPIVRIN